MKINAYTHQIGQGVKPTFPYYEDMGMVAIFPIIGIGNEHKWTSGNLIKDKDGKFSVVLPCGNGWIGGENTPINSSMASAFYFAPKFPTIHQALRNAFPLNKWTF
jgi:hypothetical protein